MKRIVVALFCSALLLPTQALAQERGEGATSGDVPGWNDAAGGAGENSLHDGAMSLSFAIPNGGNGFASGAAGVWMMFGSLNVGFNVGLALDTGGADTSWDILLAPTVRSYWFTDSQVAPFWFGQLNLRFADNGSTDTQELGIAGGLGVEWFVVDIFSISGQVGMGIDILRPDPLDPLAFGTFTSALTAQLYW